MIYVATYVDVQPRTTNDAVELMKRYRESTAAEGGSMWITVVQETFRPNRFVILEAWKEESSFSEHDKARQTQEFRSRLNAIHNSPSDQRVHQGFSVEEVHAATDSAVLNVVTHVDVPPPRREETEVLLKRLAEESRRHEGNLRYDVFQQLAPRTNHFTVFAVWKDEKAFASHELQAQTREFREALGPMLGAPYDERLFNLLPPLGGA